MGKCTVAVEEVTVTQQWWILKCLPWKLLHAPLLNCPSPHLKDKVKCPSFYFAFSHFFSFQVSSLRSSSRAKCCPPPMEAELRKRRMALQNRTSLFPRPPWALSTSMPAALGRRVTSWRTHHIKQMQNMITTLNYSEHVSTSTESTESLKRKRNVKRKRNAKRKRRRKEREADSRRRRRKGRRQRRR